MPSAENAASVVLETSLCSVNIAWILVAHQYDMWRYAAGSHRDRDSKLEYSRSKYRVYSFEGSTSKNRLIYKMLRCACFAERREFMPEVREGHVPKVWKAKDHCVYSLTFFHTKRRGTKKVQSGADELDMAVATSHDSGAKRV